MGDENSPELSRGRLGLALHKATDYHAALGLGTQMDNDKANVLAQEWAVLQRQWLESWRLGTASASATAAAGGGADAWSKMATDPSQASALFAKMFGSAQSAFEVIKGMAAPSSPGASAAPSPFSIEALSEFFGAGQGANNPLFAALTPGAGGFAGAPTQWSQTLEQMAKGWLAGAAPSNLMPSFGANREAQERRQKLTQHLAELTRQQSAYGALMLKATREGLVLFGNRLAERDVPGQQMRTPREVYDRFIDDLEEAYATVAMSAEFQDSYAALVNAQMRLRAAIATELELSAKELGLPTRSELDASHRRMAELTRRLARLEAGEGAAAAPPLPAGDKPAVKKAASAKPATPVKSRAAGRSAKPVAKRATNPRGNPRAKPAAKLAAQPAGKVKGKRAPSFASSLAAARSGRTQSARKSK